MPSEIVPSWHGRIDTTRDALLIFQACFNGLLPCCLRRPDGQEREQLVTSGNIFVYEPKTSNIKRWTDDISWSPSRVLANFLIYRELKCTVPRGKKKSKPKNTEIKPRHDNDRRFIGSLTSSYEFKEKGWFKKTINVTVREVQYNLVAYYSLDDAMHSLKTPRDDPVLKDLSITPLLWQGHF